jgi:lysozyme
MGKKKSIFSRNKPFTWAMILFLLVVGLPIGYYFYNGRSFTKYRGDFLSQFPTGYSTIGIDISHHQGEMDWELMFDDLGYDTLVQFVYCKATESIDHLDRQWERNRIQLTRLGIVHGAYHFFNGQKPPREQASHFLKHWSHRDIDLAPMLDVESEGFSDEDLIAKMKIWLTVVEKETGFRPIIYCSNHYFETKFKNDFKNYKFWIAAYSREPSSFSDPRIIYWQFSEKGQMAGTNEFVDLNVGK